MTVRTKFGVGSNVLLRLALEEDGTNIDIHEEIIQAPGQSITYIALFGDEEWIATNAAINNAMVIVLLICKHLLYNLLYSS